MSLSEVVGGYLVANPGLYGSSASYRQAWDTAYQNGVAKFGTNAFSVSAGANQGVLNTGIGQNLQNISGGSLFPNT